MDPQAGLLAKVDAALSKDSNPNRLSDVLNVLIGAFGCTTDTVHMLAEQSGMLKMAAHRGIPDVVLDKIQTIPIGKGMAGIAAERREPVQVCNLQTDASGLAKPAAKMTRMEGSLAVPILVREQVCGVLGVAKPTAYEFTDAETKQLQEIAKGIGRFLGNSAQSG